MKKPVFSIIIPSYNYAQYVSEAIYSVINQTFNRWELIIVDDGSHDNSRAVLLSFKDPRIRVYFQNNHGVSYTMNRGIRLSRGKYICFLDCDDIYHKDKLQEQFNKFREGYDIVTTKIKTINAEGAIIEDQQFDGWYNRFDEKTVFGKNRHLHFLRGNYIGKSSVALKRSLFYRYGYFDGRLIAAYDYDLWRKMVPSSKITRVNKYLLYYRYHGKNESIVNNARMKAELAIVHDRILNNLPRHKSNSIQTSYRYLNTLDPYLVENDLHHTFFELQTLKHFHSDPTDVLKDGKWIERIRQRQVVPPTQEIKPVRKHYLRRAREIYYEKGLFYLIKKGIYISLPTPIRQVWRKRKHKMEERRFWNGLQAASKAGRTNILIIIPWMVVGGADTINLDIAKALRKKGVILHYITSQRIEHVWQDKFEKYTDYIIHLEDLPTAELRYQYILKYISVARIQTILISNSGLGYDILPQVRVKYPNVKIFDLLHGRGGKREKGGFPAYSKPFDQYIDTRITSNHCTKEYLVEHNHVDARKINVIHNAVDTRKFSFARTHKGIHRRKYHISDDTFVCTFIGRLSCEKHPEIFVDIANKVVAKSQERKVKFIILGDGEMKREIEKRIQKLRLKNHILCLPQVPDPITIYACSDALILCSETEGIPYVILEAMSMSLPVIATNVGGVSEIIDSGKDGLLVDYNRHTADEAAEQVLGLMNSPSLRNQLGKSARRKIVRKFSQHVFQRRIRETLLG